MALKLDLGCGDNKLEGFTGVDFSSDCGADIVHDLTVAPYPFEKESAEEIHSAHFFEHLNGAQRIVFMEECWRILKPEGKMTIITPYWSSTRAIQDPTHQWPPICEASYFYFNKKWRDDNRLTHYGIKCNFEYSFQYTLDDELKTYDSKSQMIAFKHFSNAILDLHVALIKRPV